MTKFNNTDILNGLMVEPEDVYIFPVSQPIYSFIEKVWSSFVNKMVGLTFSNDKNIFDHSVFEVIQGNELKIVASSTHFKMKEMIGKRSSKDMREFMTKTKPISLSDVDSESAKILRKSILAFSHSKRPEVEIFNLKESKIHPNIKVLLTSTMRYAIGIPLIVKENPIGILWGIRKEKLTDIQIEEIIQQLHTLFDVIEYVIGLEVDRKGDDYFARKNIEKADTTSVIHHLLYTTQETQKDPITSIVAYSHSYKVMYRLDASFIVPTADGYSVSLKHFATEEMNDTKKIILMIPGFFCRRSVMDKLAREMSLKYGYRVFCMDMRGRSKYTLSKNGKSSSWTLDDYIQDDFPAVIEWLHKNYPDSQIVVMGHSMGGMIPRFYTGAYDKIKALPGKENIPNPYDYLAGIVSITSPNFMNLASQVMGMDFIRNGIKMLPSKNIYDTIFNLASFPVSSAVNSIDLNKFFRFILNIHSSLRQFSFSMSSKIVNLSDFIGYKQITPPEWYFFVEDVFCEESVKVLLQFIRSQLSSDKSFCSYDGSINYTEEQHNNLELPVFSIVGTLDKIVPADAIESIMDAPKIKKKKIEYYEQGHLGIIFHQDTVKKITKEADKWIRSL
jgi:alpha-beta hydrolase superfamily lysophospholipase